METLAYLHASCAYETSESVMLSSGSCEPELSEKARWKLSGVAYIRVFSLLIGLLVVGAANSAIASTLRKGDSGAEVSTLQAGLSQLGYFDGPKTGYFGSLTQEALMRFQRDLGLNPDGILGTQTQAALQRKLSANGSSSGSSNTSFNVAEVQRKLRDRGYYTGAIDGIFGSNTQKAVIAFQRESGLTADGIVGPRTLAALDTSSAIGGDTDEVLSSGTVNVGEIQRLLRDKGYYDGPTDGVYGPATRTAVIDFQQDYGLKADGVVGSQTLQALRAPSGNKTLGNTSFEPNLPPGETNFPPDSFVSLYPSETSATNDASDGRYIVVVPYQNNRTLDEVQRFAPDAFLADSRRGTFVQAGSFRDRASAEKFSNMLRSQGLDARVD